MQALDVALDKLGEMRAHGRRNAAEWTHSRWKRVFGGGLRSRSFDVQWSEARIAADALNRMAELSMPRYVWVA